MPRHFYRRSGAVSVARLLFFFALLYTALSVLAWLFTVVLPGLTPAAVVDALGDVVGFVAGLDRA